MADVTLDTLTARGALQAGDLIPVLPAGAGTLLKTTAGDVQSFVLTSVKAFGAVGDGVTDDTSAIQAAINSGLALWFPPGVYVISATLTLSTAASHGQVIRGAGPVAANGTGTGKTIIRPTAAMSVAFLIDGTAFGSYVQGFGVENLTVDMVNMADVAGSVAFGQVQAFDIHYENVRIINDGVNKRGWKFQTGAFTTGVRDVQCANVEFAGTNDANRTTTINFDNADVKSLITNWASNVTFNGGAIQQPYNAAQVVYLAPGTTPYGYAANVAGLYVAVMTDLVNTNNFTSNGCDWEAASGYPATFNDGVHGSLTLIRVIRVNASCTNTTFINGGPFGSYILDYGVNTRLLGYQRAGVGIDISTGRDVHLNDVGSLGLIVGFTNFTSWFASNTTITYTIAAATGLATFQGGLIKPGADTSTAFQVQTQAGVQVFDVSTVGGGGIAVSNGVSLGGYTDTFSTQSWLFNSSNGAGQVRQFTIAPTVDGNSKLLIRNVAGTTVLNVTTNVDPTLGGVTVLNGATLAGYSDAGVTVNWSFIGKVLNIATGGAYQFASVQVVGARRTGWSAPTGTISRASFDQSTVTLPQLAQALAALITDLTTHGLIGP